MKKSFKLGKLLNPNDPKYKKTENKTEDKTTKKEVKTDVQS